MSEIVKQAMYIKSDVKNNNNKFWEIKLYDDFNVYVRNGRVGSSGQSQPVKSFGSLDQAEKFFDKKVREKEAPRKGYTKAEVLMDDVQEVSVSNDLEDVALKQIAVKDNETTKLIQHLSKKNIHNIISSTTIKYDSSKGTFKTPLGIITKTGIDNARTVLDELIPYVKKSKYEDEIFIEKFQKYIQLIPHKVGRKLVPEDILPDIDSFQKEIQILDALDASLQDVLNAKPDTNDTPKTDHPKLFDVDVNVLDDTKEFKRIRDMYHKTKKSMHTSHKLDVKKVYTIKIKQMHDMFEKKGKPIGNIMELWHGSRVENCLSILKSGLIIPKSGASHVTGRMFGDGVYGSDISTKALNYAQGYWGHGSMDSNCFMFLVDFAMGKHYIAKGSHERFPVTGYDSTFAKESKSGVINNEMIVYNLYQCNIKFLVEFDK